MPEMCFRLKLVEAVVFEMTLTEWRFGNLKFLQSQKLFEALTDILGAG